MNISLILNWAAAEMSVSAGSYKYQADGFCSFKTTLSIARKLNEVVIYTKLLTTLYIDVVYLASVLCRDARQVGGLGGGIAERRKEKMSRWLQEFCRPRLTHHKTVPHLW